MCTHIAMKHAHSHTHRDTTRTHAHLRAHRDATRISTHTSRRDTHTRTLIRTSYTHIMMKHAHSHTHHDNTHTHAPVDAHRVMKHAHLHAHRDYYFQQPFVSVSLSFGLSSSVSLWGFLFSISSRAWSLVFSSQRTHARTHAQEYGAIAH